jgi:ABC-2 type transport system permease protein
MDRSLSASPDGRLPTVLPGAQPDDLLSPHAEAAVFWRLRRRMTSTTLRQTLGQARLRVTLIVVLSATLWLALFWLFNDGFAFLRSAIPGPDLYDKTVQAVFGMFFMSLAVMLVFSTAIILYSSLYRSPDVAFLLTLPARVDRIFLHKFQEAVLLSSWAFILLGSPMLLAYGLVMKAPWYYFAMLVPYLIAFTYLPAGVGAMTCLLVVRFLPRGRLLVTLLLAAAVVAMVVAIGWSLRAGFESNLLTPNWFQDMIGRLGVTEHRLLPSWWLSAGLLATSRDELRDGVLFLGLMISNALFFRQLATLLSAGIYRSGYSRLQGGQGLRRRIRTIWIDRLVTRLTAALPPPVRLLILKDVRLFRRDPVQWSQFLIFLGLLILYFVNIRRFQYDTYYVGWVNMVSFLNVSVVGLLLSTFTTRFVFPMISLESRRFWVLGLVSVRRETILWSKFLFALGGSLLPCCALVLLSDLMLRVEPLILASHQLTCLVLCLGLSGIAVGLGAKMPSLREDSPSRIAAGFGGTLNLVLSTVYIVVIVLLTALPTHFYLGAQSTRTADLIFGHARLETWLSFWLVAGTFASLVLGAAATIIPLRIGFRAFRELEF